MMRYPIGTVVTLALFFMLHIAATSAYSADTCIGQCTGTFVCHADKACTCNPGGGTVSDTSCPSGCLFTPVSGCFDTLSTSNDDDTLSAGQKAGIIIPFVVVAVGVSIYVFLKVRSNRSMQKSSPSPETAPPSKEIPVASPETTSSAQEIPVTDEVEENI